MYCESPQCAFVSILPDKQVAISLHPVDSLPARIAYAHRVSVRAAPKENT
jgi:hypothetical protein